MRQPLLPLNALRAFEAAARHLSFAKAADELNVTPGALSHQIRGLEDLLGVKLFERKVRAVALSAEGRELLPDLQMGFTHLRAAMERLAARGASSVLVLSTPPGFTSKWLAPRLYRFSSAHPEADVRVSSSMGLANFRTDGIDAGIRTLPLPAPENDDLEIELLMEISYLPVCSPRLGLKRGSKPTRDKLKGVPLIHDESFAAMPDWAAWLTAAGLPEIEQARGLRFNSPDHALDAAIEGAGLLLANHVLAYDDLRTGRLVAPFSGMLPSRRGYFLVTPKSRRSDPRVEAMRTWLREEVGAMEAKVWGREGLLPPKAGRGLG